MTVTLPSLTFTGNHAKADYNTSWRWLQKGYYHRNTNFQTYVDVPHKAFVSGEHTTVDPPHLRMVFDAAVVNSLLPPASQHSASLPQQPAVAARNNTLIPQAEGLLAKDTDETSIQTQAAAQSGRCDASTPHILGEQTQLVDEPAAENSIGCNVGLHNPADLSQCSGAAQAVLATSTAESLQAPHGIQSAMKAADGQSQSIHDNHNQSRLDYRAQQGPVETELCIRLPQLRCGSSAGLPDATDSNGCQENTRAAEWDSVLKHSMQLAKNIKWTHKGLQVCLLPQLFKFLLCVGWLVASACGLKQGGCAQL